MKSHVALECNGRQSRMPSGTLWKNRCKLKGDSCALSHLAESGISRTSFIRLSIPLHLGTYGLHNKQVHRNSASLLKLINWPNPTTHSQDKLHLNRMPSSSSAMHFRTSTTSGFSDQDTAQKKDVCNIFPNKILNVRPQGGSSFYNEESSIQLIS